MTKHYDSFPLSLDQNTAILEYTTLHAWTYFYTLFPVLACMQLRFKIKDILVNSTDLNNEQ